MQTIELVAEQFADGFFSMYFRSQKDKQVQPYVAPLYAIKEESKQALYNALRLVAIYSLRDDAQPDGRKLGNPGSGSTLVYRQWIGRLKESEYSNETIFPAIVTKATAWFNRIAKKKHDPNLGNTTYKYPAMVVFGDNVTCNPRRPVADVLSKEDAVDLLKASYNGGNMTPDDFFMYPDLLVDFFGSVDKAKVAFGTSDADSEGSLPDDPVDALEPLP
jgi:hypothetical protein